MSASPGRTTVALVREVSPRLAECELTHLGRQPIDIARAAAQHHVYCDVLAELGARILTLPPLPDAPDGVFVEDTAVVLDELAVMARPGVASRADETASTAATLSTLRPLRWLSDHATLEGGDVMRVGRVLYVGQSGRTNQAGIDELAALLAPVGYHVRAVALHGCLHLKTACTFVPPNIVLANTSWVDPSIFRDCSLVAVAEGEPFGANTLTLGGVTLVPSHSPKTAARLAGRDILTRPVDLSELAKAEGALTCSSLIVA